MASAFNAMASDLEASKRAIEDYSRNLEIKVDGAHARAARERGAAAVAEEPPGDRPRPRRPRASSRWTAPAAIATFNDRAGEILSVARGGTLGRALADVLGEAGARWSPWRKRARAVPRRPGQGPAQPAAARRDAARCPWSRPRSRAGRRGHGGGLRRPHAAPRLAAPAGLEGGRGPGHPRDQEPAHAGRPRRADPAHGLRAGPRPLRHDLPLRDRDDPEGGARPEDAHRRLHTLLPAARRGHEAPRRQRAGVGRARPLPAGGAGGDPHRDRPRPRACPRWRWTGADPPRAAERHRQRHRRHGGTARAAGREDGRGPGRLRERSR